MEKAGFVDLGSQCPLVLRPQGAKLFAPKGLLQFDRACVGAAPSSVGWENTDPSSAGRRAALVHEFTVAKSLS